MPLLEIQDVHHAYPGGRDVLAGVSLSVEAGETVAVIGPNGAGKSTLLRLVSGWLRPTAGRILVAGEDVHGMARRRAARLSSGVAADEGAPFPYTVRETVALGRHPWRGTFGQEDPADAVRIDAAIGTVGLAALAARPLTSLSSGERQRAAIARCLAQEGRLVLLDEPTAHLDLGHRLRMLALFRDRARHAGQAVLAVLHDLNLAAVVADR
ncbi:MAG: ABC transporter ATP-binding protein, partial [Planctomycetota bacterium]